MSQRWDGLIRRLEAAGITVTGAGKATRVALGQDEFTFVLEEGTRRERHVPTGDELKADEQRKKRLERRWNRSDTWAGVGLGDFSKAYPDWNTVYTGELAVQIEGYGGRGLRKRWADGKSQRVERMLDAIAGGVRAYLAGAKAEREQREEQERQRQHLQRRREKARLRRERETTRLAFLTSLTDQRGEVARLEAWLAAAAGHEESANLQRMNRWVRERLVALRSSLDPAGIENRLEEQQLFPEIDGLDDPEGEPPKDPYGFY